MLSDLRSHAVRDALAGFGAGLDAVRAEYRAGPLARRTSSSPRSRSTAASSPTTKRAATARRAPTQRRDGERVLEDLRSLCRAAQTYADQHRRPPPRCTGFLEHAAGLHAEEIRPGEDRRITVSTIHRAKGTEARLVAAARLRGAAAALLARAAEPPTPRTSTRNGGCSTSPPPAPRTSSCSPAATSAADAPPAAPRASSPRPALDISPAALAA